MKRLFAALFLISTCVLFAQDSPPDRTVGLKNGRFWQRLETVPAAKEYFLVGTIDGWDLRTQAQDSTSIEVFRAMSPAGPHFTMGDLSSMVTSIYSDAENLPLPIGWVVMGCVAVARGDVTRDAVFAALRKQLAKISSMTKDVPMYQVGPVTVIEELRSKHPDAIP